DWHGILAFIDRLIPRRHVATIHMLMERIDMKIAGFLRGQLMVVIFLALFYGLGLTVIGLEHGFLIGLAAGVLSFVPYLGNIFGLVASLSVAWVQDGSLSYMAMAAAVFGVGQLIESNFVTPRFLGKSVGLHPLWIIFAV